MQIWKFIGTETDWTTALVFRSRLWWWVKGNLSDLIDCKCFYTLLNCSRLDSTGGLQVFYSIKVIAVMLSPLVDLWVFTHSWWIADAYFNVRVFVFRRRMRIPISQQMVDCLWRRRQTTMTDVDTHFLGGISIFLFEIYDSRGHLMSDDNNKKKTKSEQIILIWLNIIVLKEIVV